MKKNIDKKAVAIAFAAAMALTISPMAKSATSDQQVERINYYRSEGWETPTNPEVDKESKKDLAQRPPTRSSKFMRTLSETPYHSRDQRDGLLLHRRDDHGIKQRGSNIRTGLHQRKRRGTNQTQQGCRFVECLKVFFIIIKYNRRDAIAKHSSCCSLFYI